MLRTALPGCDDEPYRRAFKVLLSFEKEEKKRVYTFLDVGFSYQKKKSIHISRLHKHIISFIFYGHIDTYFGDNIYTYSFIPR